VMVLEKAAARGIREAAERAPRLSLGLHFALTGGGRPSSPAKALPVLAPDGRFRRRREDLPAEIPAAEVRRELEAQIGVFQVLARKPPSHLDSHHHVALHPSVAPVFAAVARERSLATRAPTDECRRVLRAAGVRTPDAFVDRFYAENVSLSTLESILDGLGEGTSELMCHPGVADPELQASSTYAAERERELRVLCDPGLRGRIRKRGIALVDFGAL
jgi:chitin disaccharide deacetylase